jgi:hypothetical protein
MKITVRGWNRDMGEKVIANHFLPVVKHSENGTAYRDHPVMYNGGGGVTVAWYQQLKLTGNYRMEVNLSYYDVKRLFGSTFGWVLNSSLIEKDGFTMTPEFVKAVLRTVKLTDLTLGDLVAMNSTPAVEETTAPEEPTTKEQATEMPSNVKPFGIPRRKV